ncbi:MAG: D-2-hydroxyacid dehydrogenase [Negativicutes bacterium]|nr:D-2-hydroxyacid dehydrogenase [Negativicutes bacterium]
MIHSVADDIAVISCELDEAGQYIADADILVAWGWMDIRPLFLRAAKLKWLHALSAGVETLIFPEMQNSGIILTNSRGIHGIPISEHIFAMMLTFTRGLHLLLKQQAAKKWRRVPTDELHEKTLGIIGLGSIGREIAKKAKGLGMNVVATKRAVTTELFVDKLYPADQLHEMLPLCDFVVVALPLTEDTKGYFRLEHFQAMKPTAYFFNIARGAVVNEPDLITALEQGLIAGAGLDVFENEPLPEESPLWERENVIITPHLAALSPYYLDRAIKLFADNLARYVNGREMLNIIDKHKGY